MRHSNRLERLRKAAGSTSALESSKPLNVTPDEAEQIFDVLQKSGVDVFEVVKANAERQGIQLDFSG